MEGPDVGGREPHSSSKERPVFLRSNRYPYETVKSINNENKLEDVELRRVIRQQQRTDTAKEETKPKPIVHAGT